jgi:hypothetical protein
MATNRLPGDFEEAQRTFNAYCRKHRVSNRVHVRIKVANNTYLCERLHGDAFALYHFAEPIVVYNHDGTIDVEVERRSVSTMRRVNAVLEQWGRKASRNAVWGVTSNGVVTDKHDWPKGTAITLGLGSIRIG